MNLAGRGGGVGRRAERVAREGHRRPTAHQQLKYVNLAGRGEKGGGGGGGETPVFWGDQEEN